MKKRIICFFVFFILIVLIVVTYFIFKSKDNTKIVNENKDFEFKVSKVKYYSSCNALSNTTNYQNPEWNIKVYQYTDIAIYLERLGEISNDNYITSLKLSNFDLSDKQEIYYLKPTMFGNSNFTDDDGINDLEFNVINTSNSDDEQTYNIPIFFQDCSNPITLRVVNVLSENYKVSSSDSLIYNGSLIEKLGISLDDLPNDISFDLEITTKNGEKRVKNVELTIPFEDKKRSILDGDFETQINEDIGI